MSLLFFKAGVIVSKQAIIAAAVVNAANQIGFMPDMVVTSGSDGQHMSTSKHYTDEALDIRTQHLDQGQKMKLRDTVQQRLGLDYDVILESLGLPNEHLHCEWDPE